MPGCTIWFSDVSRRHRALPPARLGHLPNIWRHMAVDQGACILLLQDRTLERCRSSRPLRPTRQPHSPHPRKTARSQTGIHRLPCPDAWEVRHRHPPELAPWHQPAIVHIRNRPCPLTSRARPRSASRTRLRSAVETDTRPPRRQLRSARHARAPDAPLSPPTPRPRAAPPPARARGARRQRASEPMAGPADCSSVPLPATQRDAHQD